VPSPQWWPQERCDADMPGFFNGWASTSCGRPKGHTIGDHWPVPYAFDRPKETKTDD
jgi:hypothetical protein